MKVGNFRLAYKLLQELTIPFPTLRTDLVIAIFPLKLHLAISTSLLDPEFFTIVFENFTIYYSISYFSFILFPTTRLDIF